MSDTQSRHSDLDIDHMIPLAEAWDSGARNWTTSRRQAFANDLGDSRPLVAVKDTVNQAKGDKDPAEWMPPYSAATCRYLREWVAVKIRWHPRTTKFLTSFPANPSLRDGRWSPRVDLGDKGLP